MTRRNSLTATRIETCAGFVPRGARAERATSPEQKSSRSFHDLTTLTIRQVIDFHSIPLYITCNNNNHPPPIASSSSSSSSRRRRRHISNTTHTAFSTAKGYSSSTFSRHSGVKPPDLQFQATPQAPTSQRYTTTAFNMTVLPKYEAELAYLVFQNIAEPVAERKHTRASSSLTFLTYQTYRRTLQHLCSRSIQHWPKAGGTMLRCRRPLHFQTSPRNTLCPIRRRR